MTPEFQIKDWQVEILHEQETEVLNLQEVRRLIEERNKVIVVGQNDVARAQEQIAFLTPINIELQKESDKQQAPE